MLFLELLDMIPPSSLMMHNLFQKCPVSGTAHTKHVQAFLTVLELHLIQGKWPMRTESLPDGKTRRRAFLQHPPWQAYGTEGAKEGWGSGPMTAYPRVVEPWNETIAVVMNSKGWFTCPQWQEDVEGEPEEVLVKGLALSSPDCQCFLWDVCQRKVNWQPCNTKKSSRPELNWIEPNRVNRDELNRIRRK